VATSVTSARVASARSADSRSSSGAINLAVSNECLAMRVLESATEELTRPPRLLLKDSLVCESCDSLLNYGVSECRECGARYLYSEGKPRIDDSPRVRAR
jgi:hypothetical protein